MYHTQTNQSVYQALDAANSEIRVIILHKGPRDQQLSCNLRTVSLDDQPEFHALSYVWGDDTDIGRISIDGQASPVAACLATVLEHLRAHHYDSLRLHSTPLWIDAICINQADPEERARQVALMSRIYRQASRVLLWIGEGDEFSDYAFDRIGDGGFRASCEELQAGSRAPGVDEVRAMVVIEENLENREYWTRTWILQEVVLATRDPVMLCGSRRVLWSWYAECRWALPWDKSAYPSLAPVWDAVESEVPFYPDDARSTGSDVHARMRHHYWEAGSISLGDALTASVQLRATDPRDRVYGVLGLIPHRELLLVDIDYRKTPEQVFRDTMAGLWAPGADGLISTVIPRLIPFGREDAGSEVPSWAPELTRHETTERYSTSNLMVQTRPWRPQRRPEIHVEGHILTINAILFDKVAEVVELDFNHGWSETLYRGKGPLEVDIEPLQDLEAMAQRVTSLAIPPSSRLAPFSALRGKMPIWSALTSGLENEPWSRGEYGSAHHGWLSGGGRDKSELWGILMDRQSIPEAWKASCSPELRDNLPALEAAVLAPLLHAIRRKVYRKKVFFSECGFLGVGTKDIESGDVITFIVGMTCMYMLRPFRDGYRIVGFANVSGLMDWDDLDSAMAASSLCEEALKIY
ncbi:hypothetical protein KVR01_000678 [Diaporthe batatas]|uniref:uncharacterized protein n=1 Tax=Diaporthe batatas TaxID=748121 RepID=UPI001D044FF9|nr:uncharacterized protein KVR01_000678 [Diaporthe batatas]KAG8169933.1 hypothetical protein KVR01_000678 [Diaporthe batatas]